MSYEAPVPAGDGLTRAEMTNEVLVILERGQSLPRGEASLVIQVFVYPGAYATHATWAAVLLYLMARGPGLLSVDHWLAGRQGSLK